MRIWSHLRDLRWHRLVPAIDKSIPAVAMAGLCFFRSWELSHRPPSATIEDPGAWSVVFLALAASSVIVAWAGMRRNRDNARIIFSVVVSVGWSAYGFDLLDSPGHLDFRISAAILPWLIGLLVAWHWSRTPLQTILENPLPEDPAHD